MIKKILLLLTILCSFTILHAGSIGDTLFEIPDAAISIQYGENKGNYKNCKISFECYKGLDLVILINDAQGKNLYYQVFNRSYMKKTYDTTPEKFPGFISKNEHAIYQTEINEGGLSFSQMTSDNGKAFGIRIVFYDVVDQKPKPAGLALIEFTTPVWNNLVSKVYNFK
ncbi:MAG: hypothetical protein Q4F07_08585 [Bacteroidales bacterium]|nr:hypothetical protein [Bacteroidales bacterium]